MLGWQRARGASLRSAPRQTRMLLTWPVLNLPRPEPCTDPPPPPPPPPRPPPHTHTQVTLTQGVME